MNMFVVLDVLVCSMIDNGNGFLVEYFGNIFCECNIVFGFI